MPLTRPLRSVLYVPGNNARAMEKARSLPVDVVLFDLEDAVAVTDKEAARTRVCEAVRSETFGPRLVAVRINDLQTLVGEGDLAAVLAVRPDVIVLPKVRTPADIITLAERIDADTASSGIDLQIWAMIETPQAVLNCKEIARLAAADVRRFTAMVVGTNDLARETGVSRPHIHSWMMDCVLAAKSYGLPLIDGVTNRFDDPSGLREDCQRGRAMGMAGKTLIHPRQVEICNDSFSPRDKELDEAREIIALFEQAGAAQVNVLSLKGRMVERLHYEMALETIQMSETISSMNDRLVKRGDE